MDYTGTLPADWKHGGYLNELGKKTKQRKKEENVNVIHCVWDASLKAGRDKKVTPCEEWWNSLMPSADVMCKICNISFIKRFAY